ncbi:MAG: lipid-A-disaccharide synthase [Snowella sp.]|nr:lipid-A-disaccharide synthase [Snowella sp.]
MRIFISTGEVSGDLQGSMLVEALKRQATERGIALEIQALGGELMKKAGATLLANTAAIGSVGLSEALRFILPTWKIQQRVKTYLKDNPVDALILIDYMGPNLAIAKYIRQYYPQLPIIYYIAPQAWVWSPTAKDTQEIVNITDRLLAIFPEEANFFKAKGVNVTWVGHPLLDRIARAPNREEARKNLGITPDQLAVALLPASRIQELKYLLPVICEAAQKLQEKLPQVHFWLPISLESYRDRIEATVKSYGLNVTFLKGQTLDAIAAADLAITKSGTVNLEIALLKVPQVILYRVSPLTWWVARKILKFNIPFVAPPNIVLQKAVVPELLQDAATPENIFQSALEILTHTEYRQQIQNDYQQLQITLGEIGVCDRAAKEILDFIPTTHP